jgi:hypothetical protein
MHGGESGILRTRGETTNAYDILAGKPQENRQPGSWCEDGIKINLSELRWVKETRDTDKLRKFRDVVDNFCDSYKVFLWADH